MIVKICIKLLHNRDLGITEDIMNTKYDCRIVLMVALMIGLHLVFHHYSKVIKLLFG